MFTMVEKSTRMAVSAVAAVAIVSFSGLVLDQAHIASAPRGIVEVGELTLVNEAQIASVTLPEVVVVAKRVVQLVAQGGRDGKEKSRLNTAAKSALLK